MHNQIPTYPQTTVDPDAIGYGKGGELGADGYKKGAIILPAASASGFYQWWWNSTLPTFMLYIQHKCFMRESSYMPTFKYRQTRDYIQ